MNSANFEILRKGWPELAELGDIAEAYGPPAPCFKRIEPNLGGPSQ
jgi:hypothetical protein